MNAIFSPLYSLDALVAKSMKKSSKDVKKCRISMSTESLQWVQVYTK